jgi:hypothetical protein
MGQGERKTATLILHDDVKVKLAADDIATLLVYTIRWQAQHDQSELRSFGPLIRFHNRLTSVVTVIPAADVVPSQPSDRARIDNLRDLVQDRLVIIGGSFLNSGDFHQTPLGTMPGAILLANAVHALDRFGTPREPSLFKRSSVLLVLAIVSALLFHKLRPTVAALVVCSVIAFVMVASVGRFRSGVVLDLAVPATAVLVHRWYNLLVDFVWDLRHHGLRALLAPSHRAEAHKKPRTRRRVRPRNRETDDAHEDH